MKTYNFPKSNENRVEIYTMESRETYNLQIFNAIEEIQDIIDESEGQTDTECSGIENCTLSQG
jgi:hypothetical protein